MAESESGIPTLSLESRTQLGARRVGHTQPTLQATGQSMGDQQARAQLLPSLVMLITWAGYHKHSQYPNWGISTVHHPS